MEYTQTKMKRLEYTEKIFYKLYTGGFISCNSSDEDERRMFLAINDQREDYNAYFEGIGLTIIMGNGYVHFARTKPTTTHIAKKIRQTENYMDYLHFFKLFDPSFGPGMIFSASKIHVESNTNLQLKDKIEELKTVFDRKNFSNLETIEELLKKMEQLHFIEKIDKKNSEWKVMDSFHYLEDLVNNIQIIKNTEDAE